MEVKELLPPRKKYVAENGKIISETNINILTIFSQKSVYTNIFSQKNKNRKQKANNIYYLFII